MENPTILLMKDVVSSFFENNEIVKKTLEKNEGYSYHKIYEISNEQDGGFVFLLRKTAHFCTEACLYFDKNGKLMSRSVEDLVWKGKINFNEQGNLISKELHHPSRGYKVEIVRDENNQVFKNETIPDNYKKLDFDIEEKIDSTLAKYSYRECLEDFKEVVFYAMSRKKNTQ